MIDFAAIPLANNERNVAFLKDTIAFYNKNNRAIGTFGICVYNATETSPGCAIGRHCPLLTRENGHLHTRTPVRKLVQNNPELVPDWLKEMNINFLGEVQALHDSPINWDDSGLNVAGKRHVNYIIDGYKLPMARYDLVVGNE